MAHGHRGVVVQRAAVRIAARLPLTQIGRTIEWIADADLAHATRQFETLRKGQEIAVGQRTLHTETIERGPPQPTARRPPVAFRQAHHQIDDGIARRLYAVGLQIHPLKGVGLIKIALRIDDRPRRIPVAGFERHRATDRGVGHAAVIVAGVDLERDPPQLGAHPRHHRYFNFRRAFHGVRGVGHQRFRLRPTLVAQPSHQRVTTGFERPAIEHATHPQREIARRVTHLGADLEPQQRKRGDAHRLAFAYNKSDLDHTGPYGGHRRIHLHVEIATSSVQRFKSLHIAAELHRIEAAPLAQHG